MMKKGFSLIELLGVISILALLTIIGTVSVNNLVNKGKEDTLEIVKKSVKTSLKLWGSDNLLYMPEENETLYMTLYQLKSLGYISDIKNPKTNKMFSNDMIVTITKNGNYEYNLIDNGEETDSIIEDLPVITYKGDILEYVVLNGTYTVPEAEASDSYNNDITDQIAISYKYVQDNELNTVASIDTSVPGTYLIYYTIPAGSNSVSIIKNAIVKNIS